MAFVTIGLVAAGVTFGVLWDRTPVSADEPKVSKVVVPVRLAEFSDQLRTHIESFVSQAKSDPSDAMRHAKLGLVYSANHLWEQARACFENAHRLDPAQPLSLYHLAIATNKLGRIEEAVALLKEVLDVDVSFAAAYHRLGDLNLDLGRLAVAERSFDQVISLAARDPAGYIGLAQVRLRNQDAGGAAKLLEHALDIDPANGNARYLLGLSYRALGRSDEATRALAKGAKGKKRYMYDEWSVTLGTHCKNVGYQVRKATSVIMSGGLEAGIDILEEALRWHPEDLGVLTKLATAYRINKHPDRALQLLERAAAIDPTLPHVPESFAKHYLSIKQYRKALRYADNAIALSEASPEAFRLRGQILMRMKRPEAAMESLKQSVRIYPTNARTHFDIGRLAMQLRRWDDARTHFADAIRHDPSMVAAHIRLARSCMQLERLDEAAQAVGTARQIAPQNRTVLAMVDELASRGY